MSKLLLPIFVHAKVDDWGLNCEEFRVLGRIARRSGGEAPCYEAVPEIARGCRLHPDTVRASLKRLIALNIIRPQYRTGQTTCYQINPLDLWNPSESNGGVTPRKQMKGRPRKLMEGGTPKVMDTHPSESNRDKVTPIEVTKINNPPKYFPSNHGKSKSLSEEKERNYDTWNQK